MSRLEVRMMSDPCYVPKDKDKEAPVVYTNEGTADPKLPGYIATPVYCPFSKHPCGTACALFNANLRRCGILAALENR